VSVGEQETLLKDSQWFHWWRGLRIPLGVLAIIGPRCLHGRIVQLSFDLVRGAQKKEAVRFDHVIYVSLSPNLNGRDVDGIGLTDR